MILRFFLLSLLIFLSSLQADFNDGRKIFNNKCSSCHGPYISISKLKINFFEKNNEMLKLDSPTENMLVYAIMSSSKKIGDPEDPEMRQVEIEDYLKSILAKPDLNNSICEPTIIKHYKTKEPMIISDEEAKNLAIFIMNYDSVMAKVNPKPKKVLSDGYDEKELLKEANSLNKKLIVYATSKTCYFCKKMKSEVLDLDDIQELQNRDYIFIEVDIDKLKLPFDLQKEFQHVTPTFFFVDNKGKLKNVYPGSWNKSDYIEILKENLQ